MLPRATNHGARADGAARMPLTMFTEKSQCRTTGSQDGGTSRVRASLDGGDRVRPGDSPRRAAEIAAFMGDASSRESRPAGCVIG